MKTIILMLLMMVAIPARAQAPEVLKQVPNTNIYIRTDQLLRLPQGFRAFIVTNLPARDIVGYPQSMVTEIEGKCGDRVFHVAGQWVYAGKLGEGSILASGPWEGEQFERKVTPGSPFERAFNMLCEVDHAK